MRRFLLVAMLIAFIGMTSAVADDPIKPATRAVQSKADKSTRSTTSDPTVIALDEELETLEAQRQIKKGYLKLAEIDVTEAQQSVESSSRNEDMTMAKQELKTAKAQLEIKTGELKEVDVKIKSTQRRLAQAIEIGELKTKAKELELCGKLAGVIAFRGAPVLSGIAEIQSPPLLSTTGSKIAVFNMAAVMKQYEKAKYKVAQLNEERKELSVELLSMREDYVNLQKEMIQTEQSPRRMEELAIRKRELLRKIEDTDRDIQKKLNEKSNAVISQVYDEIRSVAEKLMEAKGYEIVFAYPDATTPEEMKTPYVKELKLKPRAAQPFAVNKHVDLTDAIIKELNTRYPPKPEIGRRVVE